MIELYWCHRCSCIDSTLTGWRIIDPIISIVISLIILRGGYKITRNAWLILMESVPQHLDTDQIMADIKNIDGILDVHEFHLWH